MEDCIFCKIANKKVPSQIIWENENFVAFLDNYPSTEGMTLVVPKNHLDSYVFKNDDKHIHDLMSSAKKVSKILEKKLNIKRVTCVFEGIEISHLHLKLYPLRVGESLKTILNSGTYLPTQEQLHELAEKIKK